MVHHEVDVPNVVQVEVWWKLVRDDRGSRFHELLYQSGYQGFSCSVRHTEGESPATAPFNHPEDPRAMIHDEKGITSFAFNPL